MKLVTAVTPSIRPAHPALFMIAAAGAALLGAPALGAEKVDLTPKYTTGQKITFVQKTHRVDVTVMAADEPKAPAADPAPGKDAPGKDAPPKDAPSKNAQVKDTPSKEGDAKDAPPADKPAANPDDQRRSIEDQLSKGQTLTLDQTAVYELRVASATPEGTSLELELKSVDAKVHDSVRGLDAAWDSEGPADDKDEMNPAYRALRPVVGAVVKITLGPDGSITKTEGDPRVNPAAGGPAFQTYVQGLVSPDFVAIRWAPVLAVKRGGGSVSVGDTWKESRELSARFGKFVYPETWTLTSVKDGLATANLTGLVMLEGKDASASDNSLKSSSVTGACRWDLKTGTAKSASYRLKQELSLNAMGRSISRSTDLTIETTRKD